MLKPACPVTSDSLSGKKMELPLWEREGCGLRLTLAGELLLAVANQVLPVLSQAGKTLEAYHEGRQSIFALALNVTPALNGSLESSVNSCNKCPMWMSILCTNFSFQDWKVY